MDKKFILDDRIQKIRQITKQYGEENFAISFSGGKDSTVLSALIDIALPNNNIPRIYANTGIELNAIRDFVFEMQKKDNRIVILKPRVPITKMLEQEGYPFKSKLHAKTLDIYQRHGMIQSIKNYIKADDRNKDLFKYCPKKLRYQFSEDFKLRVSDKCCKRMKEDVIDSWRKEHGKPYGISGIMRSEGGRRDGAQCLSFSGKELKMFQPMAPLDKEWESWFIQEYNIEICKIYYPPYNFDRTGCKGCPFNIHIQRELDTLEKYFPNERKQCEIIWKPVYDEYRRIGYRLKPIEKFEQLSLFDGGEL